MNNKGKKNVSDAFRAYVFTPKIKNKQIIDETSKFRCQFKNVVQVIDRRAIVSLKHLASSIYHGSKFYNSKYRISNDLGIEILLSLTGQSQISLAIQSAGLTGTTKKAVLLFIQPFTTTNEEEVAFCQLLGTVIPDDRLYLADCDIKRILSTFNLNIIDPLIIEEIALQRAASYATL